MKKKILIKLKKNLSLLRYLSLIYLFDLLMKNYLKYFHFFPVKNFIKKKKKKKWVQPY